MRIIRFMTAGGEVRFGRDVDGTSAAVLRDEAGVLDASAAARAGDVAGPIHLSETGERAPVDQLLAPIRPAEILCAGRNYRGASGQSADLEAGEIELFMKPASALLDPDGEIPRPRIGAGEPELVAEGELAVILARGGRDIPEAQAMDVVLGFTIAIDVTDRRWQRPSGPPLWMRGKGFDGFCPLGPAIVSAEAVPNVESLEIITEVNGRVTRRGGAASMVRRVPRLVAEISRAITLRPGTVLLTGAPAPIEPAGDPVLRPGDTVTAIIEPIGRLSARVGP